MPKDVLSLADEMGLGKGTGNANDGLLWRGRLIKLRGGKPSLSGKSSACVSVLEREGEGNRPFTSPPSSS